MDKSDLRSIGPDDETLESSDIQAFKDSWSSAWIELEGGESPGLSTGGKAGIAVGAVGGVAVLAAVIFFFFRRRRRQGAQVSRDSVAPKQNSEKAEKSDGGPGFPGELSGEPRFNEMEVPVVRHEAPQDGVISELPGSDVLREEQKVNRGSSG